MDTGHIQEGEYSLYGIISGISLRFETSPAARPAQNVRSNRLRATGFRVPCPSIGLHARWIGPPPQRYGAETGLVGGESGITGHL